MCLFGASHAVTIEGQITQIPEQLRNMPGFDNMLLDVLVQLEGAPGTSQWTQLLQKAVIHVFLVNFVAHLGFINVNIFLTHLS